jgi:hypothetical protein
MNRSITVFVFVMITGLCTFAQTDEIKRVEFFAGYSFGSAGVNFGSDGPAGEVYRRRAGHHGFNGSAVVNVSRYFGVKGDLSGTYKTGRFSFQVPTGIQSMPVTTISFEAKASLYNFLGGIQVKDNASDARFQPFAHALVGAGHRRNTIEGEGFTCITIIPCPGSTTETAFAGAFGGGLDVRLNRRVAIRVFQADYNPIKFNAGTDHNFRFSTGLVF